MKRDCSEQPLFCFYALYCSLKVTGTVYLQRTALSFTVAGFHFGMDFTTRAASASSSGVMLRTMLTWSTEPSFSITICTITLPCAPSFCAVTGYFMLRAKYCKQAVIPPGNSGILSAIWYTGSSPTRSNLISSGFSISLMGQSSFTVNFPS